MIPGEVIATDGELLINAGRDTRRVTVANTGDRPIQVGSHYHFYETNGALQFDRERARGYLITIRRAIEDVAGTVARMREFYRQREPQQGRAGAADRLPGQHAAGPG